jgi:hypothetical protein
LEEEMKDPSEQGDRLPRRTLLRNHFFHFDGRQIASWFPSFSVEVLHTRVAADTPQIPESRIDTMVGSHNSVIYVFDFTYNVNNCNNKHVFVLKGA